MEFFQIWQKIINSKIWNIAPGKNGTIIEQSICQFKQQDYAKFIAKCQQNYLFEFKQACSKGIVMKSWEQLKPCLPTLEEYEHKKAYAGFECQRIKYWSDCLKIFGYIWKPQNTQGKKLPLIIFNRGGSLELSKLTPLCGLRWGFYNFLANGFVVIGSQYRGNDGGQGKEEFGGADVNDVLNLIPLVKSLEYIDTNNIFMLGESRGGMTTYLALKRGIKVNAVAVIGGLSDLAANLSTFPELLPRWEKIIPTLKQSQDKCLRDRSAVFWVDKLDVPILVLHGSADWRANLETQSLALVHQLQVHQKAYQLIVYNADDHSLSFNRQESEQQIIKWFRSHFR
jgi:dipeptidyl aminopeptidase/acylaminoacyl peptidase